MKDINEENGHREEEDLLVLALYSSFSVTQKLHLKTIGIPDMLFKNFNHSKRLSAHLTISYINFYLKLERSPLQSIVLFSDSDYGFEVLQRELLKSPN